MKFTTDYPKFIEWHNQFVLQFEESAQKYIKNYFNYGIIPNYRPKDMEAWVNKIDENHQQLREFLDGHRKEFYIETQEEQKQADHYGVNNLWIAIRDIIPDYLTKYDLHWTHLQLPNIADHKGISTAKHILGYAKRLKLDEANTKALEGYVSELGDLWRAAKSKGEKYTVVITTEPKAFALLGHYYADVNNSCFAQDKINPDKKYTIGANPNSFIVLIKTTQEQTAEDDQDMTIIGRAIGHYLPDSHLLCISNTREKNYGLIPFATVIPELAQQFLNTKEIGTNTGYQCVNYAGGMNYNDPNYYVFSDKAKIEHPENQTIDFPLDYSVESHPYAKDRYATWPAKVTKALEKRLVQEAEEEYKRLQAKILKEEQSKKKELAHAF